MDKDTGQLAQDIKKDDWEFNLRSVRRMVIMGVNSDQQAQNIKQDEMSCALAQSERDQ